VPNGVLNLNGPNTIAIAVWNLDGSTGGLGKVALTNYGSYASSLQVAQNTSPRYDSQKYRMPTPPGAAVDLQVPDAVQAGETFTAKATVTVPPDSANATNLTAALHVPDGWSAGPSTPASVSALHPGESTTFTWPVQAPSGTVAQASALSAVVTYTQRTRPASSTDERIVRAVPPVPPAGSDAVGDLPFLSATNGWGPVERNTSNGEQAAGDGKPITLNGVVYASGLGTNAVSDVALYLAGHCSRFTATVGVDDEQGSAGSITFSVVSDGKTLTTTPVLTGTSASVHLDVDVSGTQVLDLVVGDGGNGNGNDHGDWADARVSCT
jgi:hypothetical protein